MGERPKRIIKEKQKEKEYDDDANNNPDKQNEAAKLDELPTPTSIKGKDFSKSKLIIVPTKTKTIQALRTEETEEQISSHNEQIKVDSTDPALEQALNILKRKQIDTEHNGLLILQEKAKIVKMVTDKVMDCPTGSTTKQYNLRVAKFCDMVTSLSVYPPNSSSISDVDVAKSDK
jgi:hypothetical protein